MSSGLAGGPAAAGALGLATLERQSGGCVSGAQPARASANVKTVTVEVICFFIGFGSTAGKARQWIVSFGSLFVGRRFGGSGHLFHIFENGIELLEVRLRFGLVAGIAGLVEVLGDLGHFFHEILYVLFVLGGDLCRQGFAQVADGESVVMDLGKFVSFDGISQLMVMFVNLISQMPLRLSGTLTFS